MKVFMFLVAGFLLAGCSSTNERQQMFIEGAKTCNSICQDNPNISGYSHRAGGGVTLIFFGGMEKTCDCDRP